VLQEDTAQCQGLCGGKTDRVRLWEGGEGMALLAVAGAGGRQAGATWQAGAVQVDGVRLQSRLQPHQQRPPHPVRPLREDREVSKKLPRSFPAASPASSAHCLCAGTRLPVAGCEFLFSVAVSSGVTVRCGRVTVLKDKETRESTGVAFILFVERDDAHRTVSTHPSPPRKIVPALHLDCMWYIMGTRERPTAERWVSFSGIAVRYNTLRYGVMRCFVRVPLAGGVHGRQDSERAQDPGCASPATTGAPASSSAAK